MSSGLSRSLGQSLNDVTLDLVIKSLMTLGLFDDEGSFCAVLARHDIDSAPIPRFGTFRFTPVDCRRDTPRMDAPSR